MYRAWDSTLDREVALKILHERSPETGDTNSGQVIAEGRLMARVRHPNVVTIYGAQRIDGRTGLWMEFIHGETLESELRERGPHAAHALATIGVELCSALGAVHAAGLVHRDVKAQNVLRESSGRIILGDFGTGREFVEGERVTAELAGTPAYAAPEVFATTGGDAKGPISTASECFSFTLRRAAIRCVELRFVRCVKRMPRTIEPRCDSTRPDVPARLAAVIDRALDPDPACRFADASSMSKALAGWQAAHRRRRLPLWLAGAAATALLMGMTLWQRSIRVTSLGLQPSSWVLVADFENATEDPLLDSTLAHVLEGELAGSPVHQSRPTRTGRRCAATDEKGAGIPQLIWRWLMNCRCATEIFMRSWPDVSSQAGTAYEITARVARPRETAAALTLRERAPSQADLLTTTSRLSRRVRELLGESRDSLETNDAQLARVTTSSFKALQLYSQAEVLLRLDRPMRPAEAEDLLRQAVKEDPEFASAHLLLGKALAVQNSGFEAETQRACELSAQTSGVERLFLSATCADFASLDPRLTSKERVPLIQRAASGYEAVLRKTPSYLLAHERLLNMYERLFRFDEVRRLVGLMASARPKSFLWTVRAGMEAMGAGDMAGAREYIQRAQQLPVPDYGSIRDDVITWFKLSAARDAWLNHDGRRASAEIDRWAAEVAFFKGELRRRLDSELVGANLALGRLRAAEVHIPPQGTQGASVLRLRLLLHRGDVQVLRHFLRNMSTGPNEEHKNGEAAQAVLTVRLIDAFIFAGDIKGARRVLNRDRGVLNSWSAMFVEGKVALAEGRVDDAVTSLTLLTQERVPGMFRPMGTLAEAWTTKGNLTEAIRVLEDASRQRAASVSSSFDGAHEWLRIRARLAELYRQTDRAAEAEIVEQELLDLLAAADDDHPLKRRLIANAQH